MTADAKYRTERDSMGEMQVPVDACYGAQTQRAVENFPISGLQLKRPMIRALGVIKGAAAQTNHELGLLDEARMKAIVAAAEEVENGELDAHFPIDIFQTGSGTSSNMNANEVIAHRAAALAEGDVTVHPNDHVNMSQSSNDVIPTAIHVATAVEATATLLPALNVLGESLGRKAEAFADIVKTGRTHMQDATPITLGQEFSGYQSQISHGIERVNRGLSAVYELPQGGTAVGTGLNTHPEFAEKIIARIAKKTGLPFIEAPNHFEAHGSRDACVELSGQLRTIAVSLTKIGNDIRLMSCGPRCGFGEISLPAVQPGSSIMPGKVNPVIIESLLMVCAQVIGNDTTLMLSGQGGQLELNVMLPVISHNLLESIELLSNVSVNVANQCVDGIEPNVERLNDLAEASIAICTSLAPVIGYDKAAKLAKDAFTSGKSLREVAEEQQVLPKDQLDMLLDLMKMTKPGLE